MQYFSGCAIRLPPSPPLSLWNRFAACGEFVPLLALLRRHMLRFTMPLDARRASSPSLTYWTNLHPVFFCFQFVCAPKHLSRTFSSGMALWLPQWNAQKVSPHRLETVHFTIGHFLTSLCIRGPTKVFLESPTFGFSLFSVYLVLCHKWAWRSLALVASFHVQGVRLSFSFICCYWIEEEFISKENFPSDGGGLIKTVCRSTPQLKNTACGGAVAVQVPAFNIARYTFAVL